MFIHLRTHSAYSLSEGAITIKQMAALAREAGMPALGIADTGNLFGALEFSEALADKGIQPIIGIQLKVDVSGPATGQVRQPQGPVKLPSLVLLAKDDTGYRNLIKLTSRAYLDAPDTTEPHVSISYLEQHADRAVLSMRRSCKASRASPASASPSCCSCSAIASMSNCSGMKHLMSAPPSRD
jgi:DNA polymerase-3 subunit alpha